MKVRVQKDYIFKEQAFYLFTHSFNKELLNLLYSIKNI